MATVESTQVLQWEMYGPGTAVAFVAHADREGYRVTLERDQLPIVSGVAADGASLFRISQEMRSQLQRLGYGAKPLPNRVSVLVGGPCWGPAAPLHSSLIDTLQ